jgi:hypothetical protein
MTGLGPTWQRWGLLALVVGLAIGGSYLLRPGSPPTPPPPEPRSTDDPRRAYTGPLRNIHPDVQYVGDETCATCHHEQAEPYRQHPMARTLLPIAEASPLPMDTAHHNPFAALGAHLRVERAGSRAWQYEYATDAQGRSIYERPVAVKYAIGSGTHAQSFLWEQDGYVQQTPATWFTPKQIWDISPGWIELGGDRPVNGRCLFCHSNRVEPLPGYENRFAAPVFRGHAIGCERCHGPGEKHVARWGGDDPVDTKEDVTIVNPRKLDWPLREAVCRQCHSEGETRLVKRGRGLFDYRPGLALEDFWIIAVRSEGEEEFKVINHVEQLERSRCFQKSSAANKLGCISCHDPHVKPTGAARIAHFRQSCLNCHAQHGCAMPEADRRRQQPQDSCIDCHMTKSATQEIPHLSATDHRIPRRPAPVGPQGPEEAHAPDGVLPVRLLHRRATDPLPAEERRDLGVAVADLLAMNKLPARYAAPALGLLDEALRTVPADAAAWEAKGIALANSNRANEAYAAYQEALRYEPERETSLVAAARMAMKTGRNDAAIDLWKRAIGRNPWRPLPHACLAILSAGRQQWREGQEASDAWVRLQPSVPEARRLRVLYLLRLGDRIAAAREFGALEALNPPNLAQLRAWWQTEVEGPSPTFRPPGP